MPKFRALRRVALPAIIVIALLNFGGLQFVRDAYPADPFRSEALAKCTASDPGFLRFLPGERARCYARQPRLTHEYSPGAPLPEAALSAQ